MNLKKHIPNVITCGNLFCGCLGLMFTSMNLLEYAFILMLIGAFFDFFDGFFARILNVSSPIGKDLDSLADMVTFGVLPGFIMFKLIAISMLQFDLTLTGEVYSSRNFGMHSLETLSNIGIHNLLFLLLPFIGFLITIFSAIRLAKFNNDPRQSDSFIGVPTPANAILIGSLAFILMNPFRVKQYFNVEEFYKPSYLIVLTLLMSYLLVAELPLFALKFKNFGWADNKIRYSFLIISVILLILFQFIAIPFIIFLYIVLSVVNNSFNKQNQK